jgi:CopG family nickel-responsive transcriptional regulator
MELYVLEGTTEALSGFVNTVRAVPDIQAVDYSITSLANDSIDQHIES